MPVDILSLTRTCMKEEQIKKQENSEEIKEVNPDDKSGWKKLDQVEHFDNSIYGDWVQKGPYIINRSAKLTYAVFVGINKKLIGVDSEGKPILISRQ